MTGRATRRRSPRSGGAPANAWTSWATGSRARSPPPPGLQGLVWLLDHLAHDAHVVIVDGLGAPHLRFQLLDLVDARVLVAEPALEAADLLGRSLSLLSPEIPTWTVMNHTRPNSGGKVGESFETWGIRLEKSLTVPYDPRLAAQSDRGWDEQGGVPKPLRIAAGTLSRRLLGG